jgi:hypothetical protein
LSQQAYIGDVVTIADDDQLYHVEAIVNNQLYVRGSERGNALWVKRGQFYRLAQNAKLEDR